MNLYRRIILLTLTLLVLVSSTGMAVGLHVCGGELRDVTFFGAEADCPMEEEKEQAPACHAPKLSAEDEACCQDHQVLVERPDAAAKQKALSLNKPQDVQLLALVKAIAFRFYTSETDLKPTYALYTSPPLARDIPVLVQSFLL